MVAQEKGINTVMGWVTSIAGIALVLLIMLILFGNLQGNVGFGNASVSLSVTNETNAYLNSTGYTLSAVNSSNSAYTLTAIWGAQSGVYNVSIPLANATVSAAGVVTNATTYTNANVSYSYTYSYSYPSTGLTNTNNLIGNYTKSATNVSSQFPVVGTIAGVAILLFILIALLVFALRKMNGGAFSGKRSMGDFA